MQVAYELSATLHVQKRQADCKRHKQVLASAVSSIKRVYVIKWLIHLSLLSLDTSLHRPVSTFFNLPAIIIEFAKRQKAQVLMN